MLSDFALRSLFASLTWTVNGVVGGNANVGTVTTKGLYKAPASLPNPNTVQVTATSVADTKASDTATATLENPKPTLASLSPPSVNVGDFTLTITGTKFVNGAAVVFNGTLLPTKFVNATQLTATGTATRRGTEECDGSLPRNLRPFVTRHRCSDGR